MFSSEALQKKDVTIQLTHIFPCQREKCRQPELLQHGKVKLLC